MSVVKVNKLIALLPDTHSSGRQGQEKVMRVLQEEDVHYSSSVKFM